MKGICCCMNDDNKVAKTIIIIGNGFDLFLGLQLVLRILLVFVKRRSLFIKI